MLSPASWSEIWSDTSPGVWTRAPGPTTCSTLFLSGPTSPRSSATIEICIQPFGWSNSRRAAGSGIAA